MSSKAMQTLLAAVNKAKSAQGGFKDPNADKFWKAEQDASGNGYAVLRFLPAKSEDDVPFVKTYSHAFKGPTGKWFIENCPTTIGKECPACKGNNVLWNSGIEKDKAIVRERKRKTSYIANILVVSDSKNPDNEGKVFLFKFGQKIFEKVVGALTPEFEDEKPMNPFDLEEGANFKLKIRKYEGYTNYDKSEFDKVAPAGSAKDIKAIMAQVHDLSEFVAESAFKSFDELDTRYTAAVGNTNTVRSESVSEDDEDEEYVAKVTKKAAAKPAKKETVDEDADDDLAYFTALANDD